MNILKAFFFLPQPPPSPKLKVFDFKDFGKRDPTGSVSDSSYKTAVDLG